MEEDPGPAPRSCRLERGWRKGETEAGEGTERGSHSSRGKLRSSVSERRGPLTEQISAVGRALEWNQGQASHFEPNAGPRCQYKETLNSLPSPNTPNIRLHRKELLLGAGGNLSNPMEAQRRSLETLLPLGEEREGNFLLCSPRCCLWGGCGILTIGPPLSVLTLEGSLFLITSKSRSTKG